jgi:hypothetical protein
MDITKEKSGPSGFLTPQRREFLNTPKKERDAKYSPGNARLYDKRIRDLAEGSVRDLVLVACRSSKKDNVRIFHPADIADLLWCITDSLGDETTPDGLTYRLFINAIEDALNQKLHSEGMEIKFIEQRESVATRAVKTSSEERYRSWGTIKGK